MDTRHVSLNILSWLLLLVAVTAHSDQSVTVTPRVQVIADYSDNINLTPDNPTTTMVGQIIPGIHIDKTSLHTQFDLDYQWQNIFYTSDTLDERQHHDLDASLNYQLIDDRLTWYINAAITPTTTDIYNNAIIDTISGNDSLDDTYRGNTGLTWDQPIGPDTDISVDASINQVKYNRDSVADTQGFEWRVSESYLPQSQSGYWQLDNRVSNSFTADDNSSTFATIDAQGGIAIHPDFDIIVDGYWEVDKSETSENGETIEETINAGPGVRWSPRDNNYIALSYNYALDDGSDDYISTDISWSPTPRTSLSGSHLKRHYGDAYSFDAEHQFQRFTTNLNYTENLSSYSRELFENDSIGSQNDSVYLLRSANWRNHYTTTRGDIVLTLFWNKREYLFITSLESSELDNGIELDWSYNLNRTTSLSLLAELKSVTEHENGFEEEAKEQSYQLIFNKQLSRQLDADLTYQLQQRQSDDGSDYTENRMSLGLTYHF